jgi:ATP-dependent helicase/nuclease subunit A
MDRVEAARPRRLAAAAYEKSLALNTFARAWLAEYDRLKAVGLLDFDDLVARAVALLSDPATAAFVLWRLDGGLDHVLVDEAQDTSPPQWRVIQAITDEFFAGSGARDVPRTVFVVGDEKQSIYSFQGADPAAFAAMRAHFDAQLEAMDAALQACALLHSYRSSVPILSLVDAVFAGPAGTHFTGPVKHLASDPDRPGRVELWPFMPRPEKPQEPPWDRPLDLPMPDDPVTRLADAIAAEIRTWLDEARLIPTKQGLRAITPGDILVLVQRRSTVFHPLIRALKRHRVPVAGADVLRIGGELAVRDLLAALRVAATPPDDLALAALLRSPLGGLSEAELFRLAHGRPRRLIAALDASPHADAAAFVQDLRGQADYLRPYELLERILIRHDGRRRLTARLGPEAEDGIDALLDQALAYETVEPPTLSGFLAWITRDEFTVKRRSDDRGGEVRVMTVHGAKGLQAPVVILPDTARRQEAGRAPAILPLAGGAAAWSVPLDDCPPPLAQAEAERRLRRAAENRRLLYVALTRAESWLVVAGAGDPGDAEDASWHATVEAALGRLDATDEDGRLVLAQDWPTGRGAAAPPPPPPPSRPAGPPGRRPPPRRRRARSRPPRSAAPTRSPASRRRPTRSPAGPGSTSCSTASPADPTPSAPPAPPGCSRGRRPRRTARRGRGRARRPRPRPALRPGARTEVALAAPLGPTRILGRIDRLLVAPDRVLAVDFKSNRAVPATPAETPEAILRQMGAYAAALALLYPGRAIETAIVWTRTPALMTLPPALTAAALARALPPAPCLDPTPAAP